MNKYVKTVFSSNCAADILPFFANYWDVSKRDKEISESYGIYNQCVEYFGKEAISNSQVFVIGDGILPRTGSIFAHFSRAEVESFDPEMRMEHLDPYISFKEQINKPLKRLNCIKSRIEDCDLFFDLDLSKEVLLVFPHSHAPFEQTIERFNRKGVCPNVVNMPCCKKMKQKTIDKSNKVIQDNYILSAKNKIYFFNNLNLL